MADTSSWEYIARGSEGSAYVVHLMLLCGIAVPHHSLRLLEGERIYAKSERKSKVFEAWYQTRLPRNTSYSAPGPSCDSRLPPD